jgi:hypothetical protein
MSELRTERKMPGKANSFNGKAKGDGKCMPMIEVATEF